MGRLVGRSEARRRHTLSIRRMIKRNFFLNMHSAVRGTEVVVPGRVCLNYIVGGVGGEVVGKADEGEQSRKEDEGVKSSQDHDTQVHPEVVYLKYLRLSEGEDDDPYELRKRNTAQH